MLSSDFQGDHALRRRINQDLPRHLNSITAHRRDHLYNEASKVNFPVLIALLDEVLEFKAAFNEFQVVRNINAFLSKLKALVFHSRAFTQREE